MSDIPAYVDDLRRRERAARHLVSLTLAVHAGALAVLAVGNLVILWSTPVELVLVPAVYLVLWVVMRVRGRLTGIGRGSDGFGVMAVVALAVQVVLPIAVMFLGGGTLLGLGLVALAVRAREVLLAVGGVLLIAVYPFVNLYTFDNHAWFLGPRPGVVVGVLLAAALAALAVRAYRDERAALLRAVVA